MDPIQTLQLAYTLPTDSPEQFDLLAKLRENLEAQPNPIPILCQSLIRGVSGAQDTLLKRWTLDLLHYGISRANLPIEKRTELANQALDVLSGLLSDPNPAIVKTVIQCFGSVYPLLFRYLCINRTQKQVWDTLVLSKGRILHMLLSSKTKNGIRLAALKFAQRALLVQTRGLSDPRLQKPSDPNLSFCPADHPFIPIAQLEAEGTTMFEIIVKAFHSTGNPDMISAIVNSWSTLAKQRPSHTAQIINALACWVPTAVTGALPAQTVRCVEKAVRILLLHFSRSPQLSATFAHQINEALTQQAARMEKAAIVERERKEGLIADAKNKRSLNALSNEANEAKRIKTDHPGSDASGVLAHFDFTSLHHTMVTELIVANLQLLTEPMLGAAIKVYKRVNGLTTPDPVPPPPFIPIEPNALTAEKVVVKAEPVDPLQMDIDEEEIEFEPDKVDAELSQGESLPPDLPDGVELFDVDETLRISDFNMPPPREFSAGEQEVVVHSSMSRIWDTGGEDSAIREVTLTAGQGALPQDLWMLLLVRLLTRAVPEDEEKKEEKTESMDVAPVSKYERIRQTLFDYILTDFPARERLAITWMNEEWYNDRIRRTDNEDWHDNYPIWLQKLISAYEPQLDARDRTFSRFLLDIPQVSLEVLSMLRDLCIEPDRMQVGFTVLHDFVTRRLPLRPQAMKILLDLTTHPDKVTRGAAIITVKRWVPEIQPMADMVQIFAQRLFRRLQKRPSRGDKKLDAEVDEANGSGSSDEKDVDMEEDGEMPDEDLLQTEFLPEEIQLPADKAQVLQHVELIFALSVKSPEFLDDIFDTYGQMDISVQDAIQDLITALIRSLGPSHGKLLTLLRTFPPGAESLALRILTIFTENGRPSAPLVALVKSLMAERNLDARFLMPIIAEMDKADIVRYLPRIVSMLNGTPEAKQLVKGIFESIVTTPPQTFGSVTSNAPRVRQSELLTPAELMVLLHESEKEIGLKSAIEAIGICFSMTDVFRSEILAVVMQQIVDEPVLPVLFLRTVIQAVTTYKSLVGFVSTTLLSRLITKKIWTNSPLWEGFIRCAKVIAPASFGALLQLPKDQLRELVDKQPGLKSGLREYVLKKAGNKARQAGFLDLFGDDRSQSPVPQPQSPQSQPLPAPSA